MRTMLLKRIEQLASLNPQRSAITFVGQSYSYAALGEAVERLRGSLAARGIGPGDSVAVILPNCPHFVLAHLAVLGLGAVCVPVSVQHKAREIAWQIEDTEARAFIGWENLAGESEKALAQSESLKLRVYLGDQPPEGAESLVNLVAGGERLPAADLEESALAAIIYTAGTGGHPRGVELTHNGFTEQVVELGGMLRIRDTDIFSGTIPFSGIAGLTLCVHLPLAFGAEMHIQSRFHPGDALECLHNGSVTVCIANPAAFAAMASFPSVEKYDLGNLRYAISCENKLTEQIARDVEEKLKIRIFEGYGTTESGGIVALNLFPELTERGSVGQPVRGYEIAVLDESGKMTPPGIVGHVAVRGPSLMSGYHNRPEKTRQVVRDGWLLTGDRGRLDADGNLFITGHSSSLIVKGGFPVCASEVEEVIAGLPHVKDVAVVGIPDPMLGEEIRACVVLKEGAVIGPIEIIEYVRERVAAYKCPKTVKIYKELPRTTSGKIIRNRLSEDRL
jgi:long-chain acyl-CoA synthetase